MSEEKAKERIKAYISELTFNNGEKISIHNDDIVLFVGPNNAGKSQSLNDIFNLCGNSKGCVVIKDVATIKSEGTLEEALKYLSKGDDKGTYKNYRVENNIINYESEREDTSFLKAKYYGNYRGCFVSRLTTESRLSACNPVQIINRNDIKTSPIHYAAFDYKYSKWLSDNFRKAFGSDLTPNTHYGATIPLCMGPTVKLSGSYQNEQEREDAYAKILETYKQVHLQGDGIKSFTGILLRLMQNFYCTYLIDEPESFLHPPQARIMGQIIGETLRRDQQAFISTHSEEVVKGLLDVCEERLKIVRITREGDINSFSILDNQKIKGVFGDPLLKYSNIMSSLFHKTVALCESDSDCKMYSVIENHLKQKADKYSETLFIHCGGKQRMARTAEALKALNIDVRLIPDIDVLNDENTIKGIAEVFGIEWDSVKTDYNTIAGNLHSNKEKINRASAKADIDCILNGSQNADLSNKEIKQIQEIVKTESKWSSLKKYGKQGVPAGNATASFEKIDKEFRIHHIYLVPVGELECFVKTVGGHGPDWVNNVLEQYPDLDDAIYDEIRKFVQGIGL